MKALILAAGEGSRLSKEGNNKPKLLTYLGGISLIEHTVRNAARAGISEFIIVVGYRAREIMDEVQPRLKNLTVNWVVHENWKNGNGSSALAAREYIGKEPFLVLMADHWIHSSTLARLIAQPLEMPNSVMAVDQKSGLLTDLPDAMKVKIEDKKITIVSKKLISFDAIDIGATVCAPAFFDELEEAASESEGSCAHSDGMRRLASKGRLLFYDIGADKWEDIDTMDSLYAAEKILFNSLRKPTDGLVSRMLERHISLAITRRLANTQITPNYITALIIVVGAAAAFFFAQPGYGPKVVGAILFWCASFLDGCDGELARLKFMETRLGGWLDLWADNVVHCIVFLGMGIGIYHDTDNSLWIYLGSFAVLGVLLSVGWVSLKILWSKKHSGPLYVSVAGNTPDPKEKNWLKRLTWLADAMSRRDFIFYTIFITTLGWLPYFLWVTAIGSNVYFIILLLRHFAQRRSEHEM